MSVSNYIHLAILFKKSSQKREKNAKKLTKTTNCVYYTEKLNMGLYIHKDVEKWCSNELMYSNLM